MVNFPLPEDDSAALVLPVNLHSVAPENYKTAVFVVCACFEQVAE